MVCETHLNVARSKEVASRMKSHGFTPFYQEAVSTGNSVNGNSAGVMLLIREDWFPAAPDPIMIQQIG